jgi:hypothetical protein
MSKWFAFNRNWIEEFRDGVPIIILINKFIVEAALL